MVFVFFVRLSCSTLFHTTTFTTYSTRLLVPHSRKLFCYAYNKNPRQILVHTAQVAVSPLRVLLQLPPCAPFACVRSSATPFLHYVTSGRALHLVGQNPSFYSGIPRGANTSASSYLVASFSLFFLWFTALVPRTVSPRKKQSLHPKRVTGCSWTKKHTVKMGDEPYTSRIRVVYEPYMSPLSTV